VGRPSPAFCGGSCLNPTVGILSRGLAAIGIDWNHHLNSGQALALVIIASAWKQLQLQLCSFCRLQTIRNRCWRAARSMVPRARALAHDRAAVLMPTTFLSDSSRNLVYAFCDTFRVIHATTGGGPGTATRH